MGTTKCCWKDSKKLQPADSSSGDAVATGKKKKKSGKQRQSLPVTAAEVAAAAPPVNDSQGKAAENDVNKEKRKSETSFVTLSDSAEPPATSELNNNANKSNKQAKVHEDLTDLTGKQSSTYAKVDKSKKGQSVFAETVKCRWSYFS